MTSVEDSTVLLFDLSSSFTHVAEALVPQVGRVLYFSPWQSGFPKTKDVLPDVGMDGLQEYLREQGHYVCGAGHASVLEQDRLELRREATAAGFSVAPGEI